MQACLDIPISVISALTLCYVLSVWLFLAFLSIWEIISGHKGLFICGTDILPKLIQVVDFGRGLFTSLHNNGITCHCLVDGEPTH